jgi:anthranilate phosphoribosyltransferase
MADLLGGAPALNAELATAILAGEKGPRRDFVLLNAGAALVVAGLVATIESGIELASSVLDAGAAAAVLEALVRVSQSAAADTP